MRSFSPVLLVVFGLVWLTLISGLDMYPWGNYDFEDYTENLLERMRTYVHLDVWGNTIDNSMLPSDYMLLKNSDGNTFQLAVKDESIVNTARDPLPDPNEFTAIMNKLQESCAIYLDGYWSYEWCPT